MSSVRLRVMTWLAGEEVTEPYPHHSACHHILHGQVGITAEREPALISCWVIEQPADFDHAYPGVGWGLGRLPNRKGARSSL